MYKVGDLIIYGNSGVCEVIRITQQPRPGSEEQQDCYVLKSRYQNCLITTPTESTKVFMRPVISRQEAQVLIDAIPSIQAEAYHSRDLRQLEAHYKSSINSHSCGDLIELSMSIYVKQRNFNEQKRRLGTVDERYMRQAEDLLFGELSVALDIPKEDVPAYIAVRVNLAEKE